ncbi:unnamed protein product [Amoebophrya sp. A25]|nr:unnamed protein product [Amoebophrya sp. A25]|eukprot:GSA25T00022959001.1
MIKQRARPASKCLSRASSKCKSIPMHMLTLPTLSADSVYLCLYFVIVSVIVVVSFTCDASRASFYFLWYPLDLETHLALVFVLVDVDVRVMIYVLPRKYKCMHIRKE